MLPCQECVPKAHCSPEPRGDPLTPEPHPQHGPPPPTMRRPPQPGKRVRLLAPVLALILGSRRETLLPASGHPGPLLDTETSAVIGMKQKEQNKTKQRARHQALLCVYRRGKQMPSSGLTSGVQTSLENICLFESVVTSKTPEREGV